VDNTVGCVGICPNLSSVNAVSYVDVGIADAIAFAAHALTKDGVHGNTLILEVQGDDLLPVELDKPIFDVIKVATAAGVVVIAAAGNGGKNLDNVKDRQGRKVLNRGSNDFRDSGAIMVGAAYSGVPHRRFEDSNYGSRIDCFAWGEGIYTTNSNSPSDTTSYTDDFNRTSGATPIVAGAVISLQGIATARLGRRFNPLEMRSILADKAVNTSSSNPSRDRIGVMPNLRGVIRKHFPGIVE
jgi:serine protease